MTISSPFHSFTFYSLALSPFHLVKRQSDLLGRFAVYLPAGIGLNKGDAFMLHRTRNRRIGGLLAALGSSLLIVLALVVLLKLSGATTYASDPPATQQESEPAGADLQQSCAGLRNVPLPECQVLVELYTATGGAHWLANSGWLSFTRSAPCHWYGVTCSGGHITELNLASNNLSGTLPLTLNQLIGLKRLRLERNVLRGPVPPTICALGGTLVDADFSYNALYTKRLSVARCLKALDVDWQATQTTPVADLRPTEFFTDAIRLAWTPIPYQQDGGYYEIGIGETITGPFTLLGQTTDKTTSTYLVKGLQPGRTYYFLVRSYTAPHTGQPSAVHSDVARAVGVSRSTLGRVLVAAYFPADNDLATEIGYVIERFRRGTALNPNLQVQLLVDGRQDGDTRILSIAAGQVTETDAVRQKWGSTELDTADPAVLAWFLQYARNSTRAVRTVAALLGHGLPPTPEVEWPALPPLSPAQQQPAGGIPPLPKEHEFTPSDITNRGYMSAIDVAQALLAATNKGANPFDLVFFDQCFQGNLDILYEVHRSAKVFVASPNYAWLAAAYDRYFTQLTPTATPEAMAQAIIEHYQAALDPNHPNSIFWVRGADVPLIAERVSALGDALLAALQAGEVGKIATAVQGSKYADTTQCGRQNLQLAPPDELIGLGTFAQGLSLTFGLTDSYGVGAAIEALRPIVEPINKRVRVGTPYLAPDELWDYYDTISILAPLPRNSRAEVVWRASLYRSDAPFTATWSVDPLQPVTVTAGLAFAAEGRWDDFLAEWYGPLTPTVGSWCHYIPPEQVGPFDGATFTLTVALSDTDGLQLAWTPPDDQTAASYWLYSDEPASISWGLKEIIAIDRITAAFDGLDPGQYRFRLLARNAADEPVALSNLVTMTVTAVFGNEFQRYLPLVQR
jgi:hypothetical protein